MRANVDGQSASGKLISVMISVPDYALKEQAYILELSSPACLDGADFDKVDSSTRIHVFSTDNGLRKKLRSLVGKTVRVTGEPFGEENVHHHAPIVMELALSSWRPENRSDQLTTKTIERSDFSRIAVAVSPKKSFSPGRRSTPITMILCFRLAISLRMA
jgi:hypothetical protein